MIHFLTTSRSDTVIYHNHVIFPILLSLPKHEINGGNIPLTHGKTNIAVYRKQTGAWYVYPSGGGTPYGMGWGGNLTDKPVPGDYDGDEKTDIAVYHPPTGLWYIRNSSDGTDYSVAYGGMDYVPVNLIYLLGWVY